MRKILLLTVAVLTTCLAGFAAAKDASMNTAGILCNSTESFIELGNAGADGDFAKYRTMLEDGTCVTAEEGQKVKIIKELPTHYGVNFYKVDITIGGQLKTMYTLETEINKLN